MALSGIEHRRWSRIAVVLLIAVLGGVYLSTLHPGVERGDTAELQYDSALLGVCHEPGFAIEVVCGKLFSLLPIGPGVAWRVNLMMAVAAVAGCLALYGAVRRITGQILPGVIAAATLGFSSTYWNYSVVAEAYVFHEMFLLLGVYAAVRCVEDPRARWVYLAALALGVCVGGRPSELCVLPAFGGVLWVLRGRIRLGVARWVLALSLFVLPFVFSVGYVFVRERPVYLHARDDALRDRVLGKASGLDEGSWPGRLHAAAWYSAGFRWVEGAGFQGDRLDDGLTRYARMLSGAGALRREPMRKLVERDWGVGVNLGPTGLLLVVLGAGLFRGRAPWVLLGGGMFVGNFLFYLWHYCWDGLSFTVPGLAGLALLAGLGAAGRRGVRDRHWSRRLCTVLGMVTPLVLVTGNYRWVDCTTPRQAAVLEGWRELAGAALPERSVVLASYWSATACRYMFHVEAGRPDVQVMDTQPAEWTRLGAHFVGEGRPTFLLPRVPLDAHLRASLERRTPPEFVRVGLLQLNAGP